LQGDLSEAHKLLHEAVTIAAAVNHEETLCFWQPILGLVALYRGDTTEARRLLTESLQRCIEYKEKSLLARNCTHLAELALWEGELDEAAEWLAQRLTYHVEPKWITIHEVTLFWVAGRLATAQQEYLRAATLFGVADQAHSQIHDAIAGPVRAFADAALATVRAALDPAVFDEAFAAGRQLSREGAITALLAPDYANEGGYRAVATGSAAAFAH
jgi:ATP/maltotriose-dependent transcriptional regulator MalT